jgi:acetyltransferase-like isoleucine patch superfamily enzyme
MLKEIYFKALRGNKGPEFYHLDQNFPPQAVRGAIWRLCSCLFRSFKYRFRLKSNGALFFIGRNVRIYTPSMLSIGNNFMAEDGVEIVAHSKTGISMGDNVQINSYSIIRPSSPFGWEMGEGIKMGNNVIIGPHNFIGFGGKIEIGNCSGTGPNVTIVSTNHSYDQFDIPMRFQAFKNKPIIIEDDVLISANSTILPGVHIGKGAYIAAGSVVHRDVEAYSITGGVPAKKLGHRKK